ncbi:MAG: enoyl-CoA hydratase-related protein [Deferrisomatales bacterium]|nr:enoyl-CoA hydratase-related protein [Deferrisomatales bacterium]
MSSTEAHYRKEGKVGVIHLGAPFADMDSLVGFVGFLEDVHQEVAWDADVHCIVVTGRDGFAAGPSSHAAFAGLLRLKLRSLRTPAAVLGGIAKPVIAAIEGDAVGSGLELALACDLRICSESSRFALDHLVRGTFPEDGGLQRVARLVGRGAALGLALLGEEVDAKEAHRLDLVQRVVPQQDVLSHAMERAVALGEMAPYAVRYLKEAVMKGMDMPLDQGIRLEADLYFLLHSTEDRAEGIRAFREKRAPKFEGR